MAKRSCPVYEQRGAMDVVGFVGGEPGGDLGDVDGHADAAAGDSFQQRFFRIGRSPGGVVDRRLDRAGRDGGRGSSAPVTRACWAWSDLSFRDMRCSWFVTRVPRSSTPLATRATLSANG